MKFSSVMTYGCLGGGIGNFYNIATTHTGEYDYVLGTISLALFWIASALFHRIEVDKEKETK